MNFTYRGCVAPVFTAFNNDEGRSLNLSVIPEYARFLASKNVNGVLITGSVGEGPSLSTDERKQVAETWAEAVKETKQHLMIQISGTHLNAAKELAAHAESLSADSILCLPELYYKPSTVEELIEYLRIIALCAPKTPFLYYHVPQFSSVDFSMGKFCELVANKIPTFAGIKFTSSDLAEGFKALKANSNLTIFLGNDLLVGAACTIGIDSFIIAGLNFIPESILEIVEFGKGNKDLKSIKKTQDFIFNVFTKILSYGPLVETLKAAVNITTGISLGPTRASHQFLTRESVLDMEKSLNHFGLQTNSKALLELF